MKIKIHFLNVCPRCTKLDAQLISWILAIELYSSVQLRVSIDRESHIYIFSLLIVYK